MSTELKAITGRERLRVVADLIEKSPEKHEQGVWVAIAELEGDDDDAYGDIFLNEVTRTDEIPVDPFKCDTRCCIAGFSALVEPRPRLVLFDDETVDWHATGRSALDVDRELTAVIFQGDWEPVGGVVSALRHLAALPGTGTITWRQAHEAGLFAKWDGYPS